jgi:arylsulfatase A-like enzyme
MRQLPRLLVETLSPRERRSAARAFRRLGLWTATLPLACASCAPSPDPHPPDLLLVTVDTLRPDYMSMNGYDRPTTPMIDEIVAGGFYFEQAVSPVPRTTPALAALLTGAYPHTNGVRTLTDSLSPDVTTLAEVMNELGYQTLAVVTNQVLSRERGLARGFDVYDVAANARTARATTDVALRLFEGLRPEVPAFTWVHYIDPHVPYHTDPDVATRFDPDYRGRYRFHFGWNGRPGPNGGHRTFPEDLPKGIATHRNPLSEEVNAHIRRLYAADIAALDAEVGRLVAAARRRADENLILVFTADHGESLGEHDFYFDHGDYVYNAGTRVPLAIVLPKSHALHGTGRCRGWVSLVDVVPTIFELLGRDPSTEVRGQVAGRTLTACLQNEDLQSRPVFAESGYSYYHALVPRRRRNDVAGRFRAVVQDDWKLIWTPFAEEEDAWELYEVGTDPDETSNLYRPDHPAVLRLAPRLLEWAARSDRDVSPRPLSEADEAALRELGYLE